MVALDKVNKTIIANFWKKAKEEGHNEVVEEDYAKIEDTFPHNEWLYKPWKKVEFDFSENA